MDAERWRKIKEIFNEAAELSETGRQRYVSKACGTDAEMRSEIEKMLAFADEDGGEDDILNASAFEILTDVNNRSLPEKIGKYKIIREIGRGGMGVVYEAIYEADNFTQRVAVKVVKRGMDTDAILSRFRQEQKIIASLVHPNIARFLDGGMTADGLPFYAMEYVEGEFIDDYCREKNLSLNGRLDLFCEVSSAVSYAHQNLIVHRDLKSKNILVQPDGTPKLLDFGISKLLTPDLAEEEIGTATALGMMTPAYASPEQVRGEKVTTASDVYSLGVILYELLTGKKPYKFNSNSQIEIERAIRETSPTKPSEAVVLRKESAGKDQSSSTTFNSKLLRGDLDNIILKALRKKPENRYASVEKFRDDISRYQKGLPVTARAATFRYRAAKFVKRNQLALGATALVFLSLCAGISVAAWQTYVARQERQLAENRFNQVRQLANNVVFKYHDAIADLQGSTAAREMLVKDALQYLDALALESASDAELQKELALAYLKLGDVQGKIYAANIGDTQGALDSYRKSIDLFESAVKTAPDDAKAKSDLIRAYDSLAFLLMRTGGGAEVREIISKALKLYEELRQTGVVSAEHQMQFVELLIRHGDSQVGFENNLREHLKAVPIIEELVAEDPGSVEKTRQLVRVNQRIGTDYQRMGDKAEKENQIEAAKEFYRRALEHHQRMFDAAEKLYRLQPEKLSNRRYLAIASINLSDSLSRNGKSAEAVQLLEKAQSIIEENLRLDPKNNETKFELSEVFYGFADVYKRAKNEKKYLEYYEKSLETDGEVYAKDAKNLEVLNRLIANHRELAEIYGKLNNVEKVGFHRQKSENFLALQAAALRKR